MANGPVAIPFPLSSFPGGNSQEGAGRLINCTAEPLGPGGPSKAVWRRQPGISQHASTVHTGYRGGLLVNNLSYEFFSGLAASFDATGTEASLGTVTGTKKVSIARDQTRPTPNVVAVDLDNGAFSSAAGGAFAAYTGGGNLPAPVSVTWQDGYFFYMIADCRVFASPINSIGTINSQTFTTVQANPGAVGRRAVNFSGLLFCFTSVSCEVQQDVAAVAPLYPYQKLQTLEYGLLDTRAIAGFEDGFKVLIWVAQDFGVYLLQPNNLQPTKISPPDLDRLIEAQSIAGNAIEAGCYIFAGKKFWHVSSPAWTWEFNLNTQNWNERWSLNAATGLQGRWRYVAGHPAFNKWLGGDTQTGTLTFVDDTNYTELGAPQLMRIESGPVDSFPNRTRVPRADFDFVREVGQETRAIATAVTGAAAGTGGVVRLAVVSTLYMATNDTVIVASVGGTVEANGTWVATVVDATHIEIPVAFVHAYTSGGSVTDVTAPNNVINPVVAISWSDDGGTKWSNPVVRPLGAQAKTKPVKTAVKNAGTTAADMGRRWRLDISDPVYAAFLKATQSDNPREY
jgi:hypothetical protein